MPESTVQQPHRSSVSRAGVQSEAILLERSSSASIRAGSAAILGDRAPTSRTPLIGERAPVFEAESTQGPILFPDDFRGRWVVFFSHTADFTPVCTTEYMMFAEMQSEFERLNCRLLGLSRDSVQRHAAWLQAIEQRMAFRELKNIQVAFPVISDPALTVARAWGMLHPADDVPRINRCVFFVDPDGIVRASCHYPAGTGRNVIEIRRLVLALQLADRHQIATPANWQPGEDVIIPTQGPYRTVRQPLENPFEDVQYLDWLLPLTRCPE